MPGIAAVLISLGLHAVIILLMTVSFVVPQPWLWLFSEPPGGQSTVGSGVVAPHPDRGPEAVIVHEETVEEGKPFEPIHYAGNSGRGESEQPTEADEQSGQTAADAELYGQLSDREELDGLKMARLILQFKPTRELIDLMIRQGAGFVIARKSDVGGELMMRGACSAPTSWTPVSTAEEQQCSRRSIRLTEPEGLLKTLQSSISESPGSNADTTPWTIYLFFSNRFDRQLLSAQKKALQNIPESEWPNRRTIVEIRAENGTIVPVATLSEKP